MYGIRNQCNYPFSPFSQRMSVKELIRHGKVSLNWRAIVVIFLHNNA